MKKLKFSFINLGCNKNLVDTQFLLGNIFSIAGNNPNYEIDYINDPYDDEVEYVFLNTCGFISSGREEMFEEIDKLLNAGKKIYLLGCALQYFEKYASLSKGGADPEVTNGEVEGFDMWKEIPPTPLNKGGGTGVLNEQEQRNEIIKNPNIHFLSWSDWNDVTVENILAGYDSKKFGESPIFSGIRAYTNIDYGYEYLKIAEGCNNHCTFCIIPKIRGKQKSLPIEDVVKQAQELINSGVKEIILLAQDTNRYGLDLYRKSMLFELLEELEKIDGDFMYRILYLYPDILTLKHLEKLKNLKKFIPYFDIPLQHINPEILKRMGRFYDKNHILNLLDFINKNFKERFVRTNIIVGFPGETEQEFYELCDFLKGYHFDNVALFEYHDEPLAESSKLDNKVDENEIHRRFEILKGIIEASLNKGGADPEVTNGEAEGLNYKHCLQYDSSLVSKAKRLRKNMTRAERKLWYDFLRNLDVKVLRQQPIDKFIVDFYIASKKLVIEIDGETHRTDNEIKYDSKRTKILESHGLQVIRFTNDEVYENFESVCNKITEIINKIPPTPLNKGGYPKASLSKGGAEQSEAEGFDTGKRIPHTSINKKSETVGFVMGFKGNEKDPVIIVRPWLHAPEIDEYDQIKLKNIKGIFSDDGNLDIGSKILYKK